MNIQAAETPAQELSAEERFATYRSHYRCECTVGYDEFLRLVRDPDLTMEEIGRQCGGKSKQWAAFTVQRFCPEERPKSEGGRRESRGKHGPSATLKREMTRRARAELEMRATCEMRMQLESHAAHVGFDLGVAWGKGLPLMKTTYIDGLSYFVVHIRAAARLGHLYYAHNSSPTRKTLAVHDGMAVVINIDRGEVRASRLYLVTRDEFLDDYRSNIFIRLVPGGRKRNFDWESHLVSSLE